MAENMYQVYDHSIAEEYSPALNEVIKIEKSIVIICPH